MSVDNLVGSIDKALEGEGNLSLEQLVCVGTEVAERLEKALKNESKDVPANIIYASELGESCPAKIWLRHNGSPADQEPLSTSDKLRFMYGDMVESLMLAIVQSTGHVVADRQAPVSIPYRKWEVRGRIDCTIDEAVVDVKSTTSANMKKFASLEYNDPYGYLYQLGFYHMLLRTEKAGFLVVNKTTGHYEYFDYTSRLPSDEAIEERIVEVVSIAERSIPPSILPVESAPHGNSKLRDKCAGCQFKKTCFPGVRQFQYADGRNVWLTNVVKTPTLKEIV